MSGRPAIPVYWDTNVFISLFKGCSDRTAEEAVGIRHWRDAADAGEAVVVTSTITFVEVLVHEFTAEQYRAFEWFMAARVDVKDASVGVMRRAKELREHYQAKRGRGQQHGLCTPDAIHLATAANFECVELHTFDKTTSGGVADC